MTNAQRMRSDMATTDRRKTADNTVQTNRIRNDEMTETRRSNADKTIEKSRVRNDEITANRRETNDGNQRIVFALFIALLAVMAIGIYFI